MNLIGIFDEYAYLIINHSLSTHAINLIFEKCILYTYREERSSHSNNIILLIFSLFSCSFYFVKWVKLEVFGVDVSANGRLFADQISRSIMELTKGRSLWISSVGGVYGRFWWHYVRVFKHETHQSIFSVIFVILVPTFRSFKRWITTTWTSVKK